MQNCPCRTAADIKKAYEFFSASNHDFQISVCRLEGNAWWEMKVDKKTSAPKPLFPEAFERRSQDLDTLYVPTGAVWIAKAGHLKQEKTFYGPQYKVFAMDRENAVDIDTENDLRIAKAVFQMRGGQRVF